MPQEKTKAVNRLIGRMPKIGIRPTIDGRTQGVRESHRMENSSMAPSGECGQW